MMIRPLLYIVLVLTTLHAGAQGFIPPDYKAIEAAVKDKNSAYYYPPLFQRFISNDTTLTPDEYKYVYYGNFFVDKPQTKDVFDDKARKELSALNNKDSLSVDDRRAMVKLYEQRLKNNAFDMDGLLDLYYLYSDLNDSIHAEPYMYRLRGIARVIRNSGDGLTDSTGYHVLMVSNEYSMLGLLGYKFGGEQSLTNHPCDYLTLKSNKNNLAGIYFDVTQIFAGYQKMFTSDGVGEDFLKSLDKKSKKKKK